MAAKSDKFKLHFWIYLITSIVIIQIPIINIPFSWIETFFHEISHGLATLITGGSITKIQLLPNGAGYCYSHGGWTLLIAFAGYAGASFFGLMIYQLATVNHRNITKIITFAILGLIAASLILWVRDILTFVILGIISLLFVLPLKFASSNWLIYVTRIIGMTVIVNGLFSSINLIGRNGVGDAANLAQITWVPAQIWVVLWCIIGCFTLFRAFKV